MRRGFRSADRLRQCQQSVSGPWVARRREFTIRAAMGAPPSVLIRQVAVESLVVTATGGACTLAFAVWAVQTLRSILPPEISRLQEIRIDTSVAWFTVGTSLRAALLSELAPALLNTRGDLSLPSEKLPPADRSAVPATTSCVNSSL